MMAQHTTHTRSEADTMQALTYDAYRSIDSVHLCEVAPPTLKDDQIRIRTHAAAFNAADALMLRGEPFMIRGMTGGPRRPRRNFVLGRDVAGVIEAVGSAVRDLQVGDAVFGEAQGAMAEMVCVKASAVVLKPDSLCFEQVASLPVAAVTALQAVRDRGRVANGQRVLVNGASGGVGSFAVQIAASYGAQVTAVCSTPHLDLMRRIGASEVIDYTTSDITQMPSTAPYDVIIDLVGNHSLAALRRILTPTGTLVLTAGAGGPIAGPVMRMLRAALISARPGVTQHLRPHTSKVNRDDLQTLADLLRSGTVVPVIARTYPLAAAPSAMRQFVEGHDAGKIVVTMPANAAA